MPIWAPIIAGAATVAATGIQAGQTGKMNRKTMQWNEDMYARQRTDNLSDWHMQNEYNTPAAQMERFRAAGLNPNLIYGQGDNGAAGNVAQAKPGQWNPETPDYTGMGRAVGNSIQMYYDTRMQEAQISNQEKQAELLALEGQYKSLRNSKMIIDTALGRQLYGKRDIEIGYLEPMLRSNLQFANAQVSKLNQDMQLALNANERAVIAAADTHRKAVEEILTMRLGRSLTNAEIARIRADTGLKQADLELKQNGGQPTDSVISRAITRTGFLKDITDGVGSFWNYFKESNNNNFNKAFKK